MKLLPQFWQKHFLGIEASIAIAPTVALATWLLFFGGENEVEGFVKGNRTSIYRTTAGIAGTLLGFSIAVASLVLSFSGSPRLVVVRRSPHYPTLWKTFFQTTRFLGLLTATALVCLVWDRDNDPVVWLILPFCLFLGLSATRLLRVIWILEQIVELVSRPSPSRDESDG